MLIFPGERAPGSASGLRGWAIAPELGKLGWNAVCVDHTCSLTHRRLLIRLTKPSVLFLQQSRHPLNDPALYPDTPSVFDADDADILDPNHRERIAAICKASLGVIAGSRFLRDQFEELNPNVATVWTGTSMSALPNAIPNAKRERIITWAHSGPLGYPLESAFVRELLLRLAERTTFQFVIFGVAPHERAAMKTLLHPVEAAGIRVSMHAPMPYPDFLRALTKIPIGLHPIDLRSEFSRGKSFGKLLAYMSSDVAVVTTDAVDHPLFFRDGENGRMLANDLEQWTDACEALLDKAEERQAMALRARRDLAERLTTTRAASLISSAVNEWLARSHEPSG